MRHGTNCRRRTTNAAVTVTVAAGALAGRSVRSVRVQTEIAELHEGPRGRGARHTLSSAAPSRAPTVRRPRTAAVPPRRAASTVPSSCRSSAPPCRQSTARRTFLRPAGRCSDGSLVRRLCARIPRFRCRPLRLWLPGQRSKIDLAKLGVCTSLRGR